MIGTLETVGRCAQFQSWSHANVAVLDTYRSVSHDLTRDISKQGQISAGKASRDVEPGLT